MTRGIIPPGELTRLIDLSDQAIHVRDLHGRILLWNTGAERLYGYTASEALGKSADELLRTSSAEPFEVVVAILDETGEWSGELARRHRDGRDLTVHGRCELFRGPGGEPVSVMELDTDLTERKLAEQALRRSEARFRALFERSIDAVLLMPSDGPMLMGNPAARELFGRTRDELRHTELADVFDVTDPRLAPALAEHGGSVRAELRGIRSDGSTFPAEVTFTRFEDEDGAMTTSMIVRDLTERERIAKDRERLLRAEKRAGRALARQNRRLRELDELKDQLVSTVSHELRTPLTWIQGYLELLADEDAGPLTADQRRYLDAARAGSTLLLRIVQDLLDLARLEAQGMHPSREAVDLDEVARGVVEELGAAARDAGMGLRLEEGPAGMVSADPGMLARVVRNLVENALKFGEAGHSVVLRTARDDERVLLEVENVGVPIPKREQRRIFDRFARGSNALRANVGGGGLGLAIVKAIVDAHGGTVSVRSAQRLTTFTVSLPTGRPPGDDAVPSGSTGPEGGRARA